MNGLVVTGCPRASDVDRDAFDAFNVATVHEAQGRVGQLGSFIRPIYPGARVVGTAVTVSMAPSDNWMLHVAVEQCRAGDVVVAASQSPAEAGYFGELLATSLRAHGVRGLVIDGGVRDVRALSQMRFPVWSRSVTAQGAVKATPGAVNVELVCGGQIVRPGDLIIGDDDGVVVVARARAGEVARMSAHREERESATRARLAAGELGLDIYDMRGSLRSAGLIYRAHES